MKTFAPAILIASAAIQGALAAPVGTNNAVQAAPPAQGHAAQAAQPNAVQAGGQDQSKQAGGQQAANANPVNAAMGPIKQLSGRGVIGDAANAAQNQANQMAANGAAAWDQAKQMAANSPPGQVANGLAGQAANGVAAEPARGVAGQEGTDQVNNNGVQAREVDENESHAGQGIAGPPKWPAVAPTEPEGSHKRDDGGFWPWTGEDNSDDGEDEKRDAYIYTQGKGGHKARDSGEDEKRDAYIYTQGKGGHKARDSGDDDEKRDAYIYTQKNKARDAEF